MDILIDINNEQEHCRTTRFACDCLTPHCSLDVDEEWVQGKKFVTLSWWAQDYFLMQRIRWCWRMLTKGQGFENDFILREEDIPKLAELLKE